MDRGVKATIIVPWLDHSELLAYWADNLKLLEAGPGWAQHPIIFVDNGSTQEHSTALMNFAEQYGVMLIRLDKNKGFSGANNEGAVHVRTPLVIFLNNDVIVRQPFVDKMAAAAFGDGVRYVPSLVGPGPLISELNTSYLEGWCLGLPTWIFDHLGGWDEAYGPGYWDDVDLCYRATLAGIPLVSFPIDDYVFHLGNMTGLDGRFDHKALHFRNKAIMQKKFSL